MNITILSLSDQPEVLSTLMMLVLLLQLTARRAAPFSANCISPPQVFIWPHHWTVIQMSNGLMFEQCIVVVEIQ